MENSVLERQATRMEKPPRRRKLQLYLAVLLLILVTGAIVLIFFKIGKPAEQPAPEVITVSTLEEIVHVSQLSTFTSIYNGVAQVANERNSDKIDYYVAYEATVYAGINFDEVVISVDHEAKRVAVTVPEVYIIKTLVEITSLDYIFLNEKANTSTVTQAAYIACQNDVDAECQQQSAICDLARQNAVNVLTALIEPFVEQLDDEYTVTVN